MIGMTHYIMDIEVKVIHYKDTISNMTILYHTIVYDNGNVYTY